jgi:hypothetical protein
VISDERLSALRGYFRDYHLPRLQAATATLDEASRHLRIDFYFDGLAEEVDFDELEGGLLAEMNGQVWASVETVGFAVVFDAPASRQARVDPARLYPD